MTCDVVRVARQWLGTPYHHQASEKGIGADCLGLVRGVWRELYGGETVPIPAYSADWSETAQDERLWEAARGHFREVSRPPVPGDLVLFRMRRGTVAKHLGIISGMQPDPCFIHTYQGHGVVETPLSAPWSRRAVALFEFPQREA
ncbi:MAG: NlpC/P60 family protein [Pseudomonadota bacterium]